MNTMVEDIKKKSFEEGFAKGLEEGARMTTQIEAEHSEKCEKMKIEKEEIMDLSQRYADKCRWWEVEYKALEDECDRLRAQMDVVHLIFGGK